MSALELPAEPSIVDRWLAADPQDLAELSRCWREDPVLWVWNHFRAVPDLWQAEALDALVGEERLALPACKGPGKTCVLAWAILWFVSVHPHSKVACTSVTADNLRDNLWAELALWMGRSPLLAVFFELQGTQIVCRESPKTWFVSARTWPRSGDEAAQSATLAGLHADSILMVLDEAGGIPPAVGAAAEGAHANAEPGSGRVAKTLIAGNCTDRASLLGTVVIARREGWWIRHVTGDPDDPARAPRVSLTWARAQIEAAGADDPFVLINVFGRFPKSAINALISDEEVGEAMARHLREDQFAWAGKILGVDVAQEGDDRTVIQPRQGLAAFKPRVLRGADDAVIADAVISAIKRFHPDVVAIDCTGGYGNGVAAFLEAANYGEGLRRVNFAHKAADPAHRNKRTDMYVGLRDWLRAGGSLPKLEEYRTEVPAVQSCVDGAGRLYLEDKKQVKRRLGVSPDVADALALTFAVAVGPRSTKERWERDGDGDETVAPRRSPLRERR